MITQLQLKIQEYPLLLLFLFFFLNAVLGLLEEFLLFKIQIVALTIMVTTSTAPITENTTVIVLTPELEPLPALGSP
jgi:hypothetical protein